MTSAKGVMGRMEWLREMKICFNKISSNKSPTIPKSTLVSYLRAISSKLPLQDYTQYYSNNKVIALSFGEILAALYSMPGEEVSWDTILDTIVSVSIQSLECSEKSQQKVLDISYPANKLYEVPEFEEADKFEYLSLAGNIIFRTNWNFPSSLLVLNLAANDITHVAFVAHLPVLKLLNLSNNRIQVIQELPPSIVELFVGYNVINNTLWLSALRNLKLLDLCYNNINAIDSENKHIRYLKLKGNAICERYDYKDYIRPLFPMAQVDPANIIDFSEFSDEYLPFIPLKRPPRPSIDRTFHKRHGGKEPKTKHKIATKKTMNSLKSDLSKSPPSTPLSNIKRASSSSSVSIKDPVKPSFSSILKITQSSNAKTRSDSKIVINNQTLRESANKIYGNPVKAMMIAPPRRVNRKCSKSNSIETRRIKKSNSQESHNKNRRNQVK